MATSLVIGRGKVYITEWTGADYTVEPTEQALMGGFIGNCPKFEIAQEEEVKEHQDYTSGLKSIDDEVTLLGKITGAITCDNMTAANIAMYFRGDLDGTRVRMMTALEKRYRVRLVENNPKGSNTVWDLWKCKFSATGRLGLISDDYRALEYNFKTFKCEDEHPSPDSPYGVAFPSSSTTSTTTTTTTTTTSTTTTTT